MSPGLGTNLTELRSAGRAMLSGCSEDGEMDLILDGVLWASSSISMLSGLSAVLSALGMKSEELFCTDMLTGNAYFESPEITEVGEGDSIIVISFSSEAVAASI